jgi:Protein of unknown function, DUF600
MNDLIESIYPKLGQTFFDSLPSFSEAWLTFESIEDVWSYGAFYRDTKKNICYKNEHLDDSVNLLREMRKAFIDSNLPPFTQAVFYLTEAGKFSIDFGYDDVSDAGLDGDRRSAWIEKTFGKNVQIQWP